VERLVEYDSRCAIAKTMMKDKGCGETTPLLFNSILQDSQSPERQGTTGRLEVSIVFFLENCVELMVLVALSNRASSSLEKYAGTKIERLQTNEVGTWRYFVDRDGG
jgi:hypothetical protein